MGLTLLRLWRARREGALPETGGALDQAACTMESLAVIDGAVAALRSARQPAPSAEGWRGGLARGA